MVNGQAGAFTVNLRPHAGISEGQIANRDVRAIKNTQERWTGGFLATHVDRLSLAVDLPPAIQDEVVRPVREEQALAQGLADGLRGP